MKKSSQKVFNDLSKILQLDVSELRPNPISWFLEQLD